MPILKIFRGNIADQLYSEKEIINTKSKDLRTKKAQMNICKRDMEELALAKSSVQVAKNQVYALTQIEDFMEFIHADTNYQIGSVSSKVIGNYFDLKEFNKQDITKQKDEILKFLTNRKPKILKDTNGNMWLIAITGAPSIEYDNKYNAGIMDISFNFMEIGDATNEKDMMNCGIVPFTL